MNPPEVSILVVTYNRAHTLRECIDSILMQAHPSMEILVVDDGSTDDTPAVARSYGDAIDYRPLEHQGLSRSRNAAIAFAHGPFIAFLDSDDRYLYPGVIRDYLGRFREDPGLDAVASGWRILDDRGRTIGEAAPWTDAPEFDLENCLIWKPTFPSAKMFRREILEKAGGFDPAFESAMDTDLFFRILLDGARIGWLRKITCGLRQSPDSMMRNAPRQAEFLRRAVDAAFASPKLPGALRPKEPAIRYATELWLAWYLWSRGFPGEASAALALARPKHPEAAFIQARNWWRVFRGESKRSGGNTISQDEFLALALPVFPLSARGRGRLGELLDWWWNVWSGYAENSGEVALSSQAKPRPVPLMIDLTKRCIQAAKDPAPAQTITRFWDELLRKGWIRPDEKGSVVTLYLACFTRAAAARKILPAIGALGRAIRASRDRMALAAWLRFFRSAGRAVFAGKKLSAEETV